MSQEDAMPTSHGQSFARPGWLNSYTAYSIGRGIAWAAVLAIAAAVARSNTFDRILLVFFGWVIGWTSATIARLAYPPPKRRPSTGPTSFFQGFRDA
jgi:hypothetical protein